MDRHFATAPLAANLPVLMGLLGVWNLSFLNYTARTMLPYSEAMCKFPAHVQQVAMSSLAGHSCGTTHALPSHFLSNSRTLSFL
jgi:glucose-6-phosphate isomerase